MNAQGGACWLLFQFFWTSWWGIFFLLFPNCLALFSLFGSFSSSSLFLYSLFILSLKLPDHPHWYWPEPVWLVSVEGGRSFSTCVLSICSLGRMSLDPHLFSWPPEDVFATTTSIQNWDVALVWHHPLFYTPPLHCSARQVPSQWHHVGRPSAQLTRCVMRLSSRAGFLL